MASRSMFVVHMLEDKPSEESDVVTRALIRYEMLKEDIFDFFTTGTPVRVLRVIVQNGDDTIRHEMLVHLDLDLEVPIAGTPMIESADTAKYMFDFGTARRDFFKSFHGTTSGKLTKEVVIRKTE